jgi:polyphenol oxidase
LSISNQQSAISNFEWRLTPSGPVLVCRPLEDVARHVFTTRPWPLGSGSGSADAGGWNAVARVMDVESDRLLRVRQVHGAGVVVQRSREPIAAGLEADIVLGDDAAVALAIQTADCVPLLLADSRTGAVAAAHAGWRGLAQAVPRVTVEAMVREFGSRPADLVAAIGPSIGAPRYEVDSNVRARFEEAGFSAAQLAGWFSNARRPEHWYFDGWQASRDQLEWAGIPIARIHVAGLCTASDPQLFCSYRRDGSPAGRMAAAIRPRPRVVSGSFRRHPSRRWRADRRAR